MSAPPSLPWYQQSGESPSLEPGGEAIAIRAPGTVSLGDAGGRVPVHGAIRVSRDKLKEWGFEGDHPLRAVVVGAMFQQTEGAAAANVAAMAPLPPGEKDTGDTYYFSVNLLEVLGTSSAVPGPVFVFASIGPLVAEPVRVEIRE